MFSSSAQSNKVLRMFCDVALYILLTIVSLALYENLIKINTQDQGKVSSSQQCNVQGINVHGRMFTYVPETDSIPDLTDSTASEHIVAQIDAAEKNDDIQALLIEIDSVGGSPVAGEEIAKALSMSKKPSVALIRQTGASAAYWAASGANYIIASENSDVGSIGVTASFVDNVQKNKREGISFNQLSAGTFKDYGSPDKSLTDSERSLIMRDVQIIHKNFINAVAQNRKMPVQSVAAIADGSTVLGARALELGLIDQIGGYAETNQYLEKTIGKKAEICW